MKYLATINLNYVPNFANFAEKFLTVSVQTGKLTPSYLNLRILCTLLELLTFDCTRKSALTMSAYKEFLSWGSRV